MAITAHKIDRVWTNLNQIPANAGTATATVTSLANYPCLVEKAACISLGGTTAQRMLIPAPPVILGPGGLDTFTLHTWFPSSTGAGTFEMALGLFER